MPSRARSVMDRAVMSWPLKRIAPEEGLSMPMISRASVDLPPPLGPVMTTSRPAGTVRLTSRRISWVASFSGTSKEMCCSSSMFVLSSSLLLVDR